MLLLLLFLLSLTTSTLITVNDSLVLVWSAPESAPGPPHRHLRAFIFASCLHVISLISHSDAQRRKIPWPPPTPQIPQPAPGHSHSHEEVQSVAHVHRTLIFIRWSFYFYFIFYAALWSINSTGVAFLFQGLFTARARARARDKDWTLELEPVAPFGHKIF